MLASSVFDTLSALTADNRVNHAIVAAGTDATAAAKFAIRTAPSSTSQSVVLRELTITNPTGSSATLLVGDSDGDETARLRLICPAGQTIQWVGYIRSSGGATLNRTLTATLGSDTIDVGFGTEIHQAS